MCARRVVSVVLTIAVVSTLTGVANANLSDGLVGFWAFENGADLGEDAMGAYNGTVMYSGTAPLQVAGKVGMAIDFEGDNTNWIDLPDGFADFTGGITAAAWVKYESVTNWARIIDFGNGAGVDNITVTRRSLSDQMRWEHQSTSAGGYERIDAANLLLGELGNWVFVVATTTDGLNGATIANGATMTLYKNGSPFFSQSGKTEPPNVQRTRNYIAMSNWANNDLFDGAMDELGIWNRALTAAEVSQLWNGGAGLSFFVTKDKTLIWDGHTGNWGDVTTHAPNSHWVELNSGTITPEIPELTSGPSDVVFVDGGAVTVAADRGAYSLDITDGSVAVNSGSTLTIHHTTTVSDFGTLNVSGALNATTLNTEGTTRFQSGSLGAIGTINVTGGRLNLNGANLNVTTMGIRGTGVVDTGTSGVVVSGKLELGDEMEISVTGGTFEAAGADLADPAAARSQTFTLRGGTTTISFGSPAPGGAVAYWSFDNVPGGATVVNEGSLDSAANGSLQGGAAIVAGGIGGSNALGLNGAGYMEVLDAITGLGNSNASTVSLWVRTTGSGGTYMRKCDGDASWEANEATYYLRNSHVGAVRNRGRWVQGSTLVTDGDWHHMVLVNNCGSKTIYVDDGSADMLIESDFNNDNDADDTVVRVGWTTGNDASSYFNGLIDEFHIYDRALSEAEVQQLYGGAGGTGGSQIDLPYSNIAAPVHSTLVLGGGGTTTLGGISVDDGVRLGISSTSSDVRLTNLTLGAGAFLAADDRNTEVTVSGTLRTAAGAGSLGGTAEAFSVSLTLEGGAACEWGFDKSGDVVSGGLVAVNGGLELGDNWMLKFLPQAGTELFDGTEQVDLFSFTGTLTGNLGNVLFDAPADWIVDNVTLYEEFNRGGSGVNYIYLTGLETVPEPATLGLVTLGALALLRRRRAGRANA